MLWLNLLAFYSCTILAFFFYAIIHSRIWIKMSIGAKATSTDMWEVNSFVDLGLCSQSPLSPLCFLSTRYATLLQMVMAVFDLNIDEYKLGRGGTEGYREQIFNLKKTCAIKHIIIFKQKGHLHFLNGPFKMIGNNGRISPLFIYKGISITKLLNVRVQKALINKLILTVYNRSHFLWIISIRNCFNNLNVFLQKI